MKDFIQAFLLIFIAEMGDKTQIMAMAFATQYKIKHILIGVWIGAFLNHGLAIMLGSMLTQFVPLEALQLVAGVLFIAFGLLSLSIAEKDDVGENTKKYGAVFTVALAFFLGELGDKTQLTALTLSTQSTQPFLTLMGTVFGMVVVSSIGIFVGAKLGNRIPEPFIRIGAFMIFMMFGLGKIITSEYVQSMGMTFIVILLAIIMSLTVFRGLIFRRQLHEIRISALKLQAEDLKNYKEALRASVDHMCKGCQVCSNHICLVGYMKALLSEKLSDHPVDPQVMASFKKDTFDVGKAKQVKMLLDAYYAKYPEDQKHNPELMMIESILLRILEQDQIQLNINN